MNDSDWNYCVLLFPELWLCEVTFLLASSGSAARRQPMSTCSFHRNFFFLTSDQISTHYLCQRQSAAGSILIGFWGTDLDRWLANIPSRERAREGRLPLPGMQSSTFTTRGRSAWNCHLGFLFFSCPVFRNHVGLNCPWVKRLIDRWL